MQEFVQVKQLDIKGTLLTGTNGHAIIEVKGVSRIAVVNGDGVEVKNFTIDSPVVAADKTEDGFAIVDEKGRILRYSLKEFLGETRNFLSTTIKNVNVFKYLGQGNFFIYSEVKPTAMLYWLYPKETYAFGFDAHPFARSPIVTKYHADDAVYSSAVVDIDIPDAWLCSNAIPLDNQRVAICGQIINFWASVDSNPPKAPGWGIFYPHDGGYLHLTGEDDDAGIGYWKDGVDTNLTSSFYSRPTFRDACKAFFLFVDCYYCYQGGGIYSFLDKTVHKFDAFDSRIMDEHTLIAVRDDNFSIWKNDQEKEPGAV
jgi:hypothetical protein